MTWMPRIAAAALAALGLALPAAAPAAAEEQVVVAGWGGVWSNAYQTAVYEPFTAATGIRVIEEEWGGEYAKILAQVEAGKIAWDLAPLEEPQLIQGCDEGVLEPFPFEALGGRDRFLPFATHDCGIGSDTWATVLAYDADVLKETPSWADVFDLAKIPGKRGLYKSAQFLMEMALFADGVPADQLTTVLATEAGMQRALDKLSTIKDQVVWTASGAETASVLLSGDVAMTLSFNARISGAAKENNRNLRVAWPAGFWVATDMWAKIAGGPNPDNAMKLLEFMLRPEVQANIMKNLDYGMPTKAAYDLIDESVKANLPTSPAFDAYRMSYDPAFWAEHGARANEMFAAWAAQ